MDMSFVQVLSYCHDLDRWGRALVSQSNLAQKKKNPEI